MSFNDKQRRREKWEKKRSFTKKDKKNRYSFDKRPQQEPDDFQEELQYIEELENDN